ncbi:MAG: hypothetical protein IJA35_00600 [Clostridia bacterium]|nr:hypothetical protein [Oscillospiraceae bacterium]MBQ3551648.1 hypothetical protein [Clostridia bacterium]
MTNDVKEIETPHIVKQFHVGNALIKIADNYCREKNAEDVEKSLCEIARTAQANLIAAAVRNCEQGKQDGHSGGGDGIPVHGRPPRIAT